VRTRSALSSSLRGAGGGATIELAFAFALLGPPLVLGTMEMGTLIYDSIEVSNAAHAGALYGMVSTSNAANTSQIQTVAQSEASDFGSSLIVTPTTYYACAQALGTLYTSPPTCTGTGNSSVQLIQVATSVSVTPPIQCPGLPTSMTLNGSSTMEVE
jgi:Flp pilus assembly protein TadG